MALPHVAPPGQRPARAVQPRHERAPPHPDRRIRCGPRRAGRARGGHRRQGTGSGFAPGAAGRAFDRFWRGDRARTRAHAGRGSASPSPGDLSRRKEGGSERRTVPAAGRESPSRCLPRRRPPPDSGKMAGVTTGAPPPLPDRVEHTLDDGVLVLRLVHEGRANALTERMLDGIVRALDGPAAKSARVALLTGDGDRHFSSGAELGQEAPAEWVERIKRIEHGIAAVAAAHHEGPVPGHRRAQRRRDRRRLGAGHGMRLANRPRRHPPRDAAGAAGSRLHGRGPAAVRRRDRPCPHPRDLPDGTPVRGAHTAWTSAC